jgi:hypothetical protein
VGRREEDLLIAGEEVAASGLSGARRDAAHIAAIDIHDELLIAASTTSRRLEDDALSVVTEIRLGILTAKGELTNIAKMRLVGTREGE